ncbi:hypothetical protein CMO96_04520 [Candidatus Woesebacteria bacterium]|nr:hypothetical protein [Candidatus Woesebacteria bacterium]
MNIASALDKFIMKKISVVLATRNEEENIGPCLESVKGIASEIVVVDEHSTDRTREIAKSYGARVYQEPHHNIFHITKQKAMDYATGEWILQLDADERVSPKLAEEIKTVINLDREGLEEHDRKVGMNRIFVRHQRIIEERDGKVGTEGGEIVAFFIPRRNYFLGRAMKYAGTYPDGVIRLGKNGKVHLPAKSVHEQINIKGRVSWFENDLVHLSHPTFHKYMEGMNRYTSLTAAELQKAHVGLGVFTFLNYMFLKPFFVFLKLYFRYKGLLDMFPGFVWSLFSALHFPTAYLKYMESQKNG